MWAEYHTDGPERSGSTGSVGRHNQSELQKAPCYPNVIPLDGSRGRRLKTLSQKTQEKKAQNKTMKFCSSAYWPEMLFYMPAAGPEPKGLCGACSPGKGRHGSRFSSLTPHTCLEPLGLEAFTTGILTVAVSHSTSKLTKKKSKASVSISESSTLVEDLRVLRRLP